MERELLSVAAAEGGAGRGEETKLLEPVKKRQNGVTHRLNWLCVISWPWLSLEPSWLSGRAAIAPPACHVKKHVL